LVTHVDPVSVHLHLDFFMTTDSKLETGWTIFQFDVRSLNMIVYACSPMSKAHTRSVHLDLFLSSIVLQNLTGVCRSWPIPFRYVIIAHLDPTHTWTTGRREVSVPQCPIFTTTSLGLPPVHIYLPAPISTHSLWDIPSLWILWGVRLAKNQVTGNSKFSGFVHSFPQNRLGVETGKDED